MGDITFLACGQPILEKKVYSRFSWLQRFVEVDTALFLALVI